MRIWSEYLTELFTQWLQVYGKVNSCLYILSYCVVYLLQTPNEEKQVFVVSRRVRFKRSDPAFWGLRSSSWWMIGSTHDCWPAMGQVGRNGPSGPVGQGPTILKSVRFWTTGLIFGSFDRALPVESAKRITRIKFLLLRGNGYFVP